jgi:PAS domain S-box-containing protein
MMAVDRQPRGLAHALEVAWLGARRVLPRGHRLPEENWGRRHRVIAALLWLHVIGIPLYASASGFAPLHTLGEMTLMAVAAIVATWAPLAPRTRAAATTFGLVTASAMLVHISGGLIEMHFHFFVVVAVVALYEDWVVFLLAIGYVVFHHGVLGVLAPTEVYNNPDAWAEPWKWAIIHGAFVLGASAASLANWRLQEADRERVDLILAAVDEGIVGVDGEGRIMFSNAAAERLTGFKAVAVIGHALHSAIRHAQSGAGDHDSCRIAPHPQAGPVERFARHTDVFSRHDGSSFLAEYTTTPIEDRGQVVGSVLTFTDVSEREEARQTLRIRELAISSATSALAIADIRSDAARIVYVNPAFERLTQYAAEEAIGQSLSFLRGSETDLDAVKELEVAVRSGHQRTETLVGYRKDGTQFWTEVSVGPVRDDNGLSSHAVYVLTDITDRKLAEQQAEALARADKLRALGQMASGIAHDLNQSLMLVASYGDLGRQELDRQVPDVQTLRELFVTTSQAAIDGGESVKRLLRYGRQTRTDALPEPVDLAELTREVALMTAPRWRDASQAQGRPVHLELDVKGHPRAQGSAAELREVLTNLIFNALDAMPEGGVLRLGVSEAQGCSVIEISDTGLGMLPEVQAHIFEPFFTTKGDSGTGLGLAMVYGIVQRVQGTIDVDSTPGQGTRFRLSFPSVSLPQTVGDVPAKAAASPNRALRVLAVDDEPAITRAMVRLLRPVGHVVTTAASGEEAMQLLSSASVDVVISDMGMGLGMSGLELADRVHENWPNTRFILATGWGAVMDTEETRRHGVQTVLAKPYRAEDLHQALQAA